MRRGRAERRTWTLACLLGMALGPGLEAQTPRTQCRPADVSGEQVAELMRQALSDPAVAGAGDPDAVADRLLARVRGRLYDLAGGAAGYVLRCVPAATRTASSSSGATNPSSAAMVEGPNFTEMVSLALNRAGISSDETAITVNVSALAFWATGNRDVYTSPEEFRRASLPRRIAGSVTFGAELPKKEIVGFSGLPDSDELFEAVLWDLKFRVLGDRDPRAERWSGLLSRTALEGQFDAQIVGVAGRMLQESPEVMTPAVLQAVLQSLDAGAAARLAALSDELASSWLVTLKASGQHVATGGEANRYGLSLLADRGNVFGALDFTLNATVSRSFDEAGTAGMDGVAGRLESIDNLDVATALGGQILHGVIVEGRSASLNVTARAIVPLAEETTMDLAIDRDTEWKVGATLELPFEDHATIPLSLVYTNDPNALGEKKFVEGRLGLSWDFGAVTSALKRMTGG